MRKCLYALAILFALPLYSHCYAQGMDSAKIAVTLNRCWKALSHEYSTIYGLEEEEIKNYSKQRVCFTPDSVTMYYGAVYSPRYSAKKVNTEEFAQSNFDCAKQKLGMLRDSIYEITMLSLTKPSPDGIAHKMTDVIAYDGDCIYVMKDGVIFKLYDADAKKEARGSN